MNKVIFLDIDGVLNSESYYVEEISIEERRDNYPFNEISTERVKLLNKIINETKAGVVVSSTWRIGRTVDELQEILDKKGFEGEVLDKTCRFGGVSGYTIPRGCEIDAWLKGVGFQRINYSKQEQLKYLEKSWLNNYIIIDDDSDMLYNQREHFVKTSFKHGLTNEIAEKAIKILNTGIIDLYYGNN